MYQKVDKLLNSDSQAKLHIANDEILNFDMHVDEIIYETKKDENLMTNPEFWFYRGS